MPHCSKCKFQNHSIAVHFRDLSINGCFLLIFRGTEVLLIDDLLQLIWIGWLLESDGKLATWTDFMIKKMHFL